MLTFDASLEGNNINYEEDKKASIFHDSIKLDCNKMNSDFELTTRTNMK